MIIPLKNKAAWGETESNPPVRTDLWTVVIFHQSADFHVSLGLVPVSRSFFLVYSSSDWRLTNWFLHVYYKMSQIKCASDLSWEQRKLLCDGCMKMDESCLIRRSGNHTVQPLCYKNMSLFSLLSFFIVTPDWEFLDWQRGEIRRLPLLWRGLPCHRVCDGRHPATWKETEKRWERIKTGTRKRTGTGLSLKQQNRPHLTSSLDRTSSSLAMSPGHSPSCTENLLTRSSKTSARSKHCLISSGSMFALLTTTATLEQRATEACFSCNIKGLAALTRLHCQNVIFKKTLLALRFRTFKNISSFKRKSDILVWDTSAELYSWLVWGGSSVGNCGFYIFDPLFSSQFWQFPRQDGSQSHGSFCVYCGAFKLLKPQHRHQRVILTDRDRQKSDWWFCVWRKHLDRSFKERCSTWQKWLYLPFSLPAGRCLNRENAQWDLRIDRRSSHVQEKN